MSNSRLQIPGFQAPDPVKASEIVIVEAGQELSIVLGPCLPGYPCPPIDIKFISEFGTLVLSIVVWESYSQMIYRKTDRNTGKQVFVLSLEYDDLVAQIGQGDFRLAYKPETELVSMYTSNGATYTGDLRVRIR